MFFYSRTTLTLLHLFTFITIAYWAKGTNCEGPHYVISPVFFILFLTAAAHPVLLQ